MEMSKHTSRETALLQKAEQYLPGGHIGNMKLPFLIKRGFGARVWDVSGNEYIDWMMNAGGAILGHAFPTVVEAALSEIHNGSAFFSTTENAVLLAEELVRAVPCAEKVRFTVSGTDACFQAIKAARAYRGRDKIMKFEGGYHGTTHEGLMSYTPRNSYVPRSVSSSGGIPKNVQELVMTSHFNDLEGTVSLIQQCHEELAAVIVEPLQRVIAPEPGFLQGLREVTAHYKIPLIFDEIVTGFRLAYGGAQERYGVVPDLCTMGKIIGGGFPLAAVMGRADIMSVFDQERADAETYVFQVGTLNGNPVACAAGLATLAELRKEGAYERLDSIGAHIRRALADICAENEIPVQVCGEDALFDIYFADHPIRNYKDTLTADKERMSRFNAGLLAHGIWKNPLKWHTSLAHTGTDIERTIEALRVVIPTLRS